MRGGLITRPAQPDYATTVRANIIQGNGYLVVSPTPDGTLMELTPDDSTADPVSLRLTDQQREHLIVALGGYVHPPRVYLAQPAGDFDGLYLFADQDRRDAYAELLAGADTGSTPVLDRAAADRLIARGTEDEEG